MARPSLFLDTGVLVGAVVKDDPRHTAAQEVFRDISRGRWTHVVTSDFVVAEALNFVRAKVRRADALLAVMAHVVGAEDAPPSVNEFARVHSSRFAAAWDAMQRYHDQGLSFTDCTSLVLCRELDVKTIATFDRGFGAFLKVFPAPKR